MSQAASDGHAGHDHAVGDWGADRRVRADEGVGEGPGHRDRKPSAVRATLLSIALVLLTLDQSWAQPERELADHHTNYPRPSQLDDMVVHRITSQYSYNIPCALLAQRCGGVIIAGKLSQRPGASSGSNQTLGTDRRCRKRADSVRSACQRQWLECVDSRRRPKVLNAQIPAIRRRLGERVKPTSLRRSP
jgi:hypothetical protein